MEPALNVDNLGKRYRLGRSQGRYRTFRESMRDIIRAPLDHLRKLRGRPDEHVWALRDLSFSVSAGEVVGVIGRNGAGKSTLLKILSRIVEPTTGRVELYGRVGSLLEVGTGFHPELTGRENIYLNGAILGMKRQEINRQFDAIVTFAGVEKFLDTMVKHYSSGMYMRLAFSVAAHLNPEILLIDEVLAVGDASFQKKCLGKMGDVAKTGRTVLFVSHNMTAIESLCGRCIFLEDGRLRKEGPTAEIIAEYLTYNEDESSAVRALQSHPRRTGGSVPIMAEVALYSDPDVPASRIRIGDPLTIAVRLSGEMKTAEPVLGVVLKTSQGMALCGVNNRFVGGFHFEEAVSSGVISCRFENLPLMPGKYFVDLFFGNQYQDLDIVHEAISFEVAPADVFGTGRLPPASAGPIVWPASWTLETSEEMSATLR